MVPRRTLVCCGPHTGTLCSLRLLWCSEFWQGTIGTAYFLMMLYKDLRQMCVVSTASIMFIYAMGKTPRSCFSLLSKLGDSTHDRDHSAREMCLAVFKAFDNDGVHVSPLLNQICTAFYTL